MGFLNFLGGAASDMPLPDLCLCSSLRTGMLSLPAVDAVALPGLTAEGAEGVDPLGSTAGCAEVSIVADAGSASTFVEDEAGAGAGGALSAF